jgi:hypothetical protein
MKSFELHLIRGEHDVELAILAGLMEREHVPTDCANCTDEVGPLVGEFYSYAFILSDEEEWAVCIDCAASVLEPEGDDGYVEDTSYELDAYAFFDKEDDKE